MHGMQKRESTNLKFGLCPPAGDPQMLKKGFPLFQDLLQPTKYTPHYTLQWKIIAFSISFPSLLLLFFLGNFSELSTVFRLNFGIVLLLLHISDLRDLWTFIAMGTHSMKWLEDSWETFLYFLPQCEFIRFNILFSSGLRHLFSSYHCNWIMV